MQRILAWIIVLTVLGTCVSGNIGKEFSGAVVIVGVVIVGGFLIRFFKGG